MPFSHDLAKAAYLAGTAYNSTTLQTAMKTLALKQPPMQSSLQWLQCQKPQPEQAVVSASHLEFCWSDSSLLEWPVTAT